MVNLFIRHKACTIYEFYPQGANCSLTEVARLTYDFSIGLRNRVLLNMTTVVWYEFYRDRMDFWVWDYRLNHSIYFQVDVELSGYFDYPEVYFFIFSLKLASNFDGR